MKPEFDDELLSAYLDDELSEAERARVEQELADRPDSRELLEELRALRGTLGELPRHRLPSEFSAHVLGHVEPKSPAGPSAASNGQASMPLSDTTLWRRLLRPLTYAGLAAAAAVLIMFIAPEDPVEVAVHGPPPRGGVDAAAGLEDRQHGRDRQLAPPADGFDSPQISAPAAESPSTADAVQLRDNTGDGGAVSKQSGADSLSSFAGGGPAQPRKDEGFGVDPTANLPTLAEQPTPPNIDDGMLIVTCEISPEALRERSFEQILVSQRIAIENNQTGQSEKDQTANYQRFRVAPDSAGAQTASPPDEQLGRMLARGAAVDEAAQVTDVVYVEAAPELLQDTLGKLSAQPDKFLHLAVEPTSGVEEAQKWRSYSFGEGAAEGRVYRENQSLVEKLTTTEEVAADQSPLERAESTLSQRPSRGAAGVADADAAGADQPASKAAGGRGENANGALGGFLPPAPENTPTSPASGSADADPITRGRAVRLPPGAAQFSTARTVNEQSRANLGAQVAVENKADDGRSSRRGFSVRPEAATRLLLQPPAQAAGAQPQAPAPQRALFVFKLSPPSATADSAPAAEAGQQR